MEGRGTYPDGLKVKSPIPVRSSAIRKQHSQPAIQTRRRRFQQNGVIGNYGCPGVQTGPLPDVGDGGADVDGAVGQDFVGDDVDLAVKGALGTWVTKMPGMRVWTPG